MNPDGSSTEIDLNHDWASAPGAGEVAAVAAQVGAFPLTGIPPETNDTLSAALVTDLPPGRYTVLASGETPVEGIGLVEVYDADPAGVPVANLVNLSTRGFVGENNSVLIGGLVVVGTQARTYLVRGVGPKLADYGVAGVLDDPRIDLFRRTGTTEELLLSNDNWGDNANAAAVAATAVVVGAFPLEAGSRDGAMLATLAPGVYTLVVSGAPGTTGVAMVEFYEVP
jgi:hypothetical protein